MIETLQIFPGVTLRGCPDSRFHQGCLSIQFLEPMSREHGAVNALIPSILLRGSQAHPDLRSITRELDTLYGAEIGPLVRRIGDYQGTGFYCSFLEDRFALEGDRILEPLTRFAGELLLDPLTRDGIFLRDYVDSEGKNLISAMDAQLSDKQLYAQDRLLREMGGEDSFALPRLGTREQALAVTAESAWQQYRRLLCHAPAEIFYVGSMPLETVARLIEPIFRALSRHVGSLPEQTPLRPREGRELTEHMAVAQARLCMGFTTPITCRDDRFAAMQVANTVFGGGMTGKLFMNVRERLSLCYSIHASYYASKGVTVVSAGVDAQKLAVTRQEVLAQLEACCLGQITREELDAAKQALISGLRAVSDSPAAIESYYAPAALSGLNRTAQSYAAQVEQVTAEDVSAAARTLKLHTTYILEGEGQP